MSGNTVNNDESDEGKSKATKQKKETKDVHQVKCISWNTRNNLEKLENTINRLKQVLGKEGVIMLQEVRAWKRMNGYVHGGFVYITSNESEAGILISEAFERRVKKAKGGRGWYGIVADDAMFSFTHAVDIWRQTMDDNIYIYIYV